MSAVSVDGPSEARLIRAQAPGRVSLVGARIILKSLEILIDVELRHIALGKIVSVHDQEYLSSSRLDHAWPWGFCFVSE
ncbi:MAG TPA: hypothetical protein VHY18_00120 [Solirubrobacteraceae bacterium]|nr:hypothetical protein [Solirubrobacteraceae bacterium]